MVMMVIGNLKKFLTQKLWVVKKYTWRLIHLNQAKKIKKKKKGLAFHIIQKFWIWRRWYFRSVGKWWIQGMVLEQLGSHLEEK